MKIDILTLFPESFSYLDSSILKRAKENGILEINVIDIRQFSKDKHKKCDDYPFGGGAGMLMTAQPIYDAVKSVQKDNSHIVFASPSGHKLSVAAAQELSQKEHIIFICGHYEGVDQRVLDLLKPQEISIGDYVLTGGELPTMVIIDCLSRFIDGVITKESLDEESFSSGSLEYPQYTRPQVFEGLAVPDVLVSGNHQEISKWRKQQSEEKTKIVRPDLLKNE
ncbi:MAG: tRNA (guanosine(37)-N1)-methyltransferase TrmD [Clostridia bacterium]|nr:tRNA (guanosine(37)-N1)-methyltransferase TrmD [Clostridia bacterium]